MSEKEQELIAMALSESGYFGKARARTIAAYFEDLSDFFGTRAEVLRGLSYATGNKLMSEQEVQDLIQARENHIVDPTKPLADNFIAVISRGFIRRQVEMLRSLKLADMNPNPFLIRSLNLVTPEEVVRLNVYAAVTRSIVTSFGLFVQTMLGSTSDSVERVKSGWDLLKVDRNGRRHWIQVKSGPNDMDKDQIVYWSNQIDRVFEAGDRGYIGMTYGKKDNQTVTIGLLKKYLPDWEMKTLIGKDLWDFLSDDPDLHHRVLDILRSQAVDVLTGDTILQELESCVKNTVDEFTSKYGGGSEGVSRYIDDIF